jgi:cytochrome P450
LAGKGCEMANVEPVQDSVIDLPTARTHPLNPAPELAMLREESPICALRFRDGHVGWLVTSYALAKLVMTDARFSRRLTPDNRAPVGDAARTSETVAALDKEGLNVANLLRLDLPQHTKYRRILARHFTLRRVQELRPRIEKIVAERLNALAETGSPADLVETFADPVALATHCAMLGVPEDDQERFNELRGERLGPETSTEELVAVTQEFSTYLRAVIERKRSHPDDDLMSHIAALDELTHEEAFSLVFLLTLAGVNTTSGMLAIGTTVLLSHDEWWDALRDDRSRITATVEELLRFVSITQGGALPRTAVEDVDLSGTVVKAGESVLVSIPAANRDPSRFSDPDQFNPTRSELGHIAFGHGIHMCLGQHLARLELQIGLIGLVNRFPTLRLAADLADISFFSGEHQDYGVHQLPVAWP